MNEKYRADPKYSPHAHANQQVRHAVLTYVFNILGRIQDDSGEIMKIRQQLKRETVTMSSVAKIGSARPDDNCFIVAPLPREVCEKMLPIIWHRDFAIEPHVDEFVAKDPHCARCRNPDNTLTRHSCAAFQQNPLG